MKKRFKRWFFCKEQDVCRHSSALIVIFNWFLVFLVLAGIFSFAFSQVNYVFHWDMILPYHDKFLSGFLMTVIISFFSLLLSLILGIFFALGSKSTFLPWRFLSRFYVELIRGTPLLVQILVFFYVIADAFHLSNRYVAGVLILSLFAGAYLCEIIRAGIDSVSRTQLETARSLGLTRHQTYRYIVLPQVIRRILPPLAGAFASLIKDSSLLSVIAVREFTLNAQEVNAFTYSTLESYLPLAIGYLLLTLPISLFSKKLEKRFNYAT